MANNANVTGTPGLLTGLGATGAFLGCCAFLAYGMLSTIGGVNHSTQAKACQSYLHKCYVEEWYVIVIVHAMLTGTLYLVAFERLRKLLWFWKLTCCVLATWLLMAVITALLLGLVLQHV